jgi:hypothetical protein
MLAAPESCAAKVGAVAGSGSINWVRGFFRLWLVLSILWVGVIALLDRPDQHLRERLDIGRELEDLPHLWMVLQVVSRSVLGCDFKKCRGFNWL